MNKEEINKAFETSLRKIIGYGTHDRDHDKMPWLTRAELEDLYRAGYQQAVKDMEANYKNELTLIINQLRCGIPQTSNQSTILQGVLSDLIALRGDHE